MLKPVVARTKAKKRTHEDDIPTPSDPSLDGVITDEFKKLKAHLKCESCKGHCHVMSSGQHQRLDYKDLSYWAKQNVCSNEPCVFYPNDKTSSQVLGNSDKHNPPSAITLDHQRKCSRPSPCTGSVNSPEIHVHLNGLSDALRLGSSTLGSHESRNLIESTSAGSSKQGTKTCSSLSTDFSHDCVPVPFSESSPTTETSALCDQRHSKLSISDLHSAQLSEALNVLEKKHPGSNFTEMLIPLQEAGVHSLDDLLLRGKTMLVEWTGLPLHQVAALYDCFEKPSIGKPLSEDSDTPTSDNNDSEDEDTTDDEG